jgi:hypothetical protein
MNVFIQDVSRGVTSYGGKSLSQPEEGLEYELCSSKWRGRSYSEDDTRL